MNTDDLLQFTRSQIENYTKKPLNDSQINVLRGCLEGKRYREIDKLHNFSDEYSKEIGSHLWNIISDIFGVKVTKPNHKNIIEQHYLDSQTQKISDSKILPKQKHQSRDFVGRDTAITDINNLINEGRKIIVIQAAGGVGKTTLAKQYLYQNFDLVLPLEMAKDKENITAVESVVEEWLKQYFQEEPGREFGISIARLKTQLQNRKVGILIDNLEPALDERGRLIEKHNNYVRLLNILDDFNLQSFTIITSRERLCDDRVNRIYHYSLPVLTVEGWGDYFRFYQIQIDDHSLNEMHRIYGGNAKAMDILFGTIREDYQGDMATYWLNNCTLVETELKNLVESQFNRLQTLDNAAYKLLCRLACFRYQDVPRVSMDALLALLWDVPENKRRDVIKSLRNRCLVELEKSEYCLHPVVREEGIGRLKSSGEWEEVNRKAAEFWTESVKSVETVEDARKALEAYFHYLEIQDYETAAGVLVYQRNNQWVIKETLGMGLYRLGLMQQLIISINQIINNIPPQFNILLSKNYNLLGDLYWLIGNIHIAIQCHELSKKFATTGNINSLHLHIVSLFNIGLCEIDLWEFEKAISLFKQVIALSQDTTHHKHTVISWYCLGFLNSLLGFDKKAYYFIDKAKIGGKSLNNVSSWGKGYTLLFLGQTYKNLLEIEKSFKTYERAIVYAEESNYNQVKAKALTGLAELYRIQNDFKTALSHHLESIEILDKIGAKCDLAEAYYQLGLTYQKMGEIEKSHTNFNQAIQLYQEMEAPKQIEKVETAKI